MKKLFLAISVIGLISMTSCKKEEAKVENATENAVENTTEAATNAADAVENTTAAVSDVPTFSNPDIQKFAEEYAAFYKEVSEAAKSGDAAKVQDLQAKGLEWAKKAADYTQKMTPEDAQKWVDWSQKIATAAAGQ